MRNRYHHLDMNSQLIWNFRDIGFTLNRAYEGKGSQQQVLIVLGETGGMPQSELTKWLNIQPGSASEVLRKLESAGLIVRTPSEVDRRTTNVRLTEAGRIQADELEKKRAERHEKMFACLSEEEKEVLLPLLEKINEDWYQNQGAYYSGYLHSGRTLQAATGASPNDPAHKK